MADEFEGGARQISPPGNRWRAADLLVVLALAAACAQWPLFSENQNTYFVHGLARAGVGRLADDWLASTRDPAPAFSWLVAAIWRAGAPWLTTIVHGALAAVWFAALLRLGGGARGPRPASAPGLAAALVLAALHSLPLQAALGRRLAGGFPLFTDGLARQYALGPYLQPSAFAVLLLLALALGSDGRARRAAWVVAVAVAMHPGSWLSAGLTTVGLALAARRRWRRLWPAAVALAAAVAHAASFSAGASAAQRTEAARILAHERFPHHASLSLRADERTIVPLILIAAALALGWRRPRLRAPLVALTTGGVILTAAQRATGDQLALLFPWRVSTLLVPLGTALLATWAMDHALRRAPARARRAVAAGAAVGLAGLAAWGTATTIEAAGGGRRAAPVAEHLRATDRPGDVVLSPPDEQGLRLRAGVPLLVDRKSHPYAPRDVLAWRARLGAAESFYAAADPAGAAAALADLRARYGVTRVVVARDWPGAAGVTGRAVDTGDGWLVVDLPPVPAREKPGSGASRAP